ncbi:hypothetical protein F5Y18DRAFT_424518 [Xylariaceae sp. FL1019]|nr:hypothetical protein F5Y18DRAFT_424518 [Xylariaceae sp. FL1019]
MLPIIFLSGPTSTGKGTLGQMLAQHYPLSHISLGDLFRHHHTLLQNPQSLPYVTPQILTHLTSSLYIPPSLLSAFDLIPIPLLLHNSIVRGENLNIHSSRILSDAILTLETQPSPPRAVLVDGLGSIPRYNNNFPLAISELTSSFCGLTINVTCPSAIAKSRYLSRGRGDEATFERRMRSYDIAMPRFVEYLGSQSVGTVVEVVNDGSVSISQVFKTLRENLENERRWLDVVGKGDEYIDMFNVVMVESLEEVLDGDDWVVVG